MRKKFLINLVLLIFLNALVKPFWIFGIDRSVQNQVGASEYGLYFSLFSFSLLLNIILDLGITNFNNREVARNPGILKTYFSNIVLLKLLLGLLYAVIVFAIAGLVGYHGRQLHLLLFLVLNQFLASLLLYLRSNLSGLHFFKTDSLLSVLDRILMILVCSMLLWGHVFNRPFKIEWFVYAQTIAYLLTVTTAFILVLLKAKFFTLRFDIPFLIKILKKSYPFALLTILMSLYYRIDSVMLERMLPDGKLEAGIYAQAFRILDAFTMFAFLFATLLLPMFSRMIKKGESIEELTTFSFLLLMVPVAILSFILIFYRLPFMQWLYNEHTSDSSRILAVLMIAHLFISLSYIYGTLLTAGGHLKILNITAATGFIMNVVLNYFLIPKYQAYGSAFASMATQILVVIIQGVMVFRLFSLRKHLQVWPVYLLYNLALIMLNWGSTLLHGNWLLRVSGVLLAAVILAVFITGLLYRDLIRDLKKEKIENRISYFSWETPEEDTPKDL